MSPAVIEAIQVSGLSGFLVCLGVALWFVAREYASSVWSFLVWLCLFLWWLVRDSWRISDDGEDGS